MWLNTQSFCDIVLLNTRYDVCVCCIWWPRLARQPKWHLIGYIYVTVPEFEMSHQHTFYRKSKDWRAKRYINKTQDQIGFFSFHCDEQLIHFKTSCNISSTELFFFFSFIFVFFSIVLLQPDVCSPVRFPYLHLLSCDSRENKAERIKWLVWWCRAEREQIHVCIHAVLQTAAAAAAHCVSVRPLTAPFFLVYVLIS